MHALMSHAIVSHAMVSNNCTISSAVTRREHGSDSVFQVCRGRYATFSCGSHGVHFFNAELR